MLSSSITRYNRLQPSPPELTKLQSNDLSASITLPNSILRVPFLIWWSFKELWPRVPTYFGVSYSSFSTLPSQWMFGRSHMFSNEKRLRKPVLFYIGWKQTDFFSATLQNLFWDSRLNFCIDTCILNTVVTLLSPTSRGVWDFHLWICLKSNSVQFGLLFLPTCSCYDVFR